ncbi:hypothetical protein COW83_04175, partial [Candidatus Collierbacteria bacterium CG22_combo_CG10-13_8_21_14_all_43_12]
MYGSWLRDVTPVQDEWCLGTFELKSSPRVTNFPTARYFMADRFVCRTIGAVPRALRGARRKGEKYDEQN